MTGDEGDRTHDVRLSLGDRTGQGARSAGVCKFCGAARNDFANSDRSQAAKPGPQPPELGDRGCGRYSERVLLSVSTAQRISYRRSAEDAGVALTPWCRRAREAPAARASASASASFHRRLQRSCGDHHDVGAGGCLQGGGEPERAGPGGVDVEGPGLGREGEARMMDQPNSRRPRRWRNPKPTVEPSGPVHDHSPEALIAHRKGLVWTSRGFLVGPDTYARNPDLQPWCPGWSAPCR